MPVVGSSPRSTPPPLELTAGSWRDHAACHDHPRLKPNSWDDSFIGRNEGPGSRAKRIAAAVVVCRTECPVREACLADVDLNYDEGVRGGKDLRELREARAARTA